MLRRVTWLDCSVKVKAFIDGALPAQDLIDWSRAAMTALEMPPHEVRDIMSLLQDISMCTPETLRQAIGHYRRLLVAVRRSASTGDGPAAKMAATSM